MRIGTLAVLAVALAVPLAPAEARPKARGFWSGGSSKPIQPAGVAPAAAPARAGSTFLVLPGIGRAQAAPTPLRPTGGAGHAAAPSGDGGAPRASLATIDPPPQDAGPARPKPIPCASDRLVGAGAGFCMLN